MMNKDIIQMILDKQLFIKLVDGNRVIAGKEDIVEALYLLVNMEINSQKANLPDLVDAAKYGYEYHKNTSFPEHEFEDECINNFKQYIQGKKL